MLKYVQYFAYSLFCECAIKDMSPCLVFSKFHNMRVLSIRPIFQTDQGKIVEIFSQLFDHDLKPSRNFIKYHDKTISFRKALYPLLKDIYFVIYGIISEFTDKGQFHYLTKLKGPQVGNYLYTTQFLFLR